MPQMPPNPTSSSAGDSDAVFIQRLREAMEDVPLFSPEAYQATGVSSEIRCMDFPVYDGDLYNDSAQTFVISVAGAAQSLVDNPGDLTGAGQVTVDYENGWLRWHPSFPPSGAVVIRKSKVRYRDQRLLEALYGGLRAMTPYCWQLQYNTSITMQVLQWEYPLPAIFLDPRVRILDVQIQDIPVTLNPPSRLPYFRSVRDVIQIPASQSFTPGAQLKVIYAGPYESLADLPDSEKQLPLLWAKGFLLSNREIVRARTDTANITQGENAQPPGISQNAGAFFFSEFLKEAQALARPVPIGPMLSTYARV